MDNVVLANGLRGNSRLKSFLRNLNRPEDCDLEVLAIASALRENKGLVELHLTYDLDQTYVLRVMVSGETWKAVCDSLKTHPTLEVLNLWSRDAPLPPAVLKTRIQALVGMMKVNMLIHTIHLDFCYRQHELFRGSVIPYLETNRFRPRVHAIRKTRPIPYRAKVMGRALLNLRIDANSFWMFLSGNAEVAIPSRTTTTVAAASLPTPATTVNVAAVVAATAAATRSASTMGAYVPANVATSTDCQKRKARP